MTNRTSTNKPANPNPNPQVGLVPLALRSILIFILWISPWYYAGATWSFQYLLFFPGILLALLLGWSSAMGPQQRSIGISPPAIAWVLLLLGLFAELQSLRYVDLDSPVASSLPSLQIQRWGLGLSSETGEKCGLSALEPEQRKLALSVEPLTTQGASSSLFLCALLVWGASAVWGHRKSYPQLLILITVLGVLVGLYGTMGVFNRSKPNLLGLSYGSSFSVFVSKNSAGAFLNIVLASAIGLAVWRAEKLYSIVAGQMRSRDMRQWPWNAKFQYGLKVTFEKLDATVVASGFVVLFLAFCVAISLCRGAFFAAIVAIFFAVAVAWPGKKRNALIAGCFIAMVCVVLAMASLQLDQTALSRIESIESIDLQAEKQSGRLYIWGVAARAAKHYGWLGSGLGTFHVAALPFQSPSSIGWYYHAESLVAEIFVTLGYLGAFATATALSLAVYCLLGIYHARRFRDYLPLQIAGAFFLASQTLHACIDFAWILPGVYVPSALFLGAILGGNKQSKRAYRLIHNQKEASENPLQTNGLRVAGVGFALLCACFLLLNQRTLSVLALGEKAEKILRLDGAPGKQSESLSESKTIVDRWADISADAYSMDHIQTIYRSPTMLRLLASGIVYDTRVELWRKRPPASSSEAVWNQTSPVVMRLAIESSSDEDRPRIIESLGGATTIDRLARARDWYAQGHILSPLDWRMVWGRLSTSLDCTPQQLKPLLPVLAKNSAHRPANLTSGSLLFHPVLNEEEKLSLWQPAIAASLAESIPIAGIIAKTYPDDQIPVDLFPDSPQTLRKIYNEIFTANEFPITHEKIGEKLVLASSKLPWTGLRKATWMADVARETGKVDLEIQNLTIILGLDRSNVPQIKRMLTLLIDTKQKDKAKGFLRQLMRESPSEPEIDTFNQQIDGIQP